MIIPNNISIKGIIQIGANDGNDNFKISKEALFDIIPKTPYNEYLFRAFYEKN